VLIGFAALGSDGCRDGQITRQAKQTGEFLRVTQAGL